MTPPIKNQKDAKRAEYELWWQATHPAPREWTPQPGSHQLYMKAVTGELMGATVSGLPRGSRPQEIKFGRYRDEVGGEFTMCIVFGSTPPGADPEDFPMVALVRYADGRYSSPQQISSERRAEFLEHFEYQQPVEGDTTKEVK